MSVVNKMLRDLEDRDTSEQINGDYQQQSRQWPRYALLVVGVIAIGVIVIWQRSLWPFSLLSESVESSLHGVPDPVFSSSAVPAEPVPTSPTSHSQPRTQGPQQALAEDPNNTQVGAEPAVDAVASTEEQSDSPTSFAGPALADSDADGGNSAAQGGEAEDTSLDIRTGESPVVARLRRQAKGALAAGDGQRAQEPLRQWLNLAPHNDKVRAKLASLVFDLGNVEEAERLLMTGVSLSPNNKLFPMMAARLYLRRKQTARALELLQKHPFVNMDYIELRASVAQEAGDYRQAQSDYQQLVALSPRESRFWLGLGVAADRLKDINLALVAYRRVGQLAGSKDIAEFAAQRLQALGG